MDFYSSSGGGFGGTGWGAPPGGTATTTPTYDGILDQDNYTASSDKLQKTYHVELSTSSTIYDRCGLNLGGAPSFSLTATVKDQNGNTHTSYNGNIVVGVSGDARFTRTGSLLTDVNVIFPVVNGVKTYTALTYQSGVASETIPDAGGGTRYKPISAGDSNVVFYANDTSSTMTTTVTSFPSYYVYTVGLSQPSTVTQGTAYMDTVSFECSLGAVSVGNGTMYHDYIYSIGPGGATWVMESGEFGYPRSSPGRASYGLYPTLYTTGSRVGSYTLYTYLCDSSGNFLDWNITILPAP